MSTGSQAKAKRKLISLDCSTRANRRSASPTIARSAAFEHLYKRARTLDIGVEGAKEANPGLVGIADLPADFGFGEQFRLYFHPRLA